MNPSAYSGVVPSYSFDAFKCVDSKSGVLMDVFGNPFWPRLTVLSSNLPSPSARRKIFDMVRTMHKENIPVLDACHKPVPNTIVAFRTMHHHRNLDFWRGNSKIQWRSRSGNQQTSQPALIFEYADLVPVEDRKQAGESLLRRVTCSEPLGEDKKDSGEMRLYLLFYSDEKSKAAPRKRKNSERAPLAASHDEEFWASQIKMHKEGGECEK
jgi:hypothetical protein